MEGVTETPVSMDRALSILKEVFISAAERDILTGDGIFINVISKDGLRAETFPLRRD
jgi:20S proteasome subunit beta 6